MQCNQNRRNPVRTGANQFSKKQIAILISSALSLLTFSTETLAIVAVINNNLEKLVNYEWNIGVPGSVEVGINTPGTLTVSSGGHLITNVITIGNRGGDGLVNVTDGGIITIDNSQPFVYPLSIGGSGGSGDLSKGTKGVLNISGAGSQVVLTLPNRQLSIGSNGAEGTLNITEGGKLLTEQQRLSIGSSGSAETKGMVTIDGIGSELSNKGEVLIGVYNDGKMQIKNGGALTTDYIGIGAMPATMTADSLLTVTGAGSLAAAVGNIVIGGNILESSKEIGKGTAVISNQGTLKASQIHIAKPNGSIGELAIGSRKGEVATAAGNIETDSINFGSGQGSLVFNHTDNDFELTAVINGKGSVEAISGTTILSGANAFTGITNIATDATIQAGATNTFSANSTYQIESNGTLNLNHYDQTIGNLTNAGTVILGRKSQNLGTTLTVAGDYVGNQGTLILNGAQLNADNDSLTDKLVITGNSSGSTKVSVNNIGGLGAQTINGIEIIQVQGISDGIFTQDGRIVAGAYDYFLARGEEEKKTSAQNWYLSSQLTHEIEPEQPNDDTPDRGIIRPEAGAYLGLIEYNQSTFNHSFYDRQQLLDNQYQPAWVRVEYTHEKSKAAYRQLENKAKRTLIHFGADVFQQDQLHLGLMGAYAKGDIDTSAHLSGNTAKAKSEGYSAGVYGTWFDQDQAKSGLYLDTYAQYNWFDNKVNGKGLPQESFHTNGYTLSAEAGYGFSLGKYGNMTWQVEPQVQFLYNSYQGKDRTEKNGTRITVNDTHDFISRVGVRFQGKSEGFEPFVTLNYWNHNKNATISMNETQVNSERAHNMFEVKAGGEINLNKNLDLFAQVSSSWGKHSTHAYGGNIGLKMRW